MRDRVTSGLVVLVATAFTGCARFELIVSEPTADIEVMEFEIEKRIDLASACGERQVGSVEFDATLGKARARIRCQAAPPATAAVNAEAAPPPSAPAHQPPSPPKPRGNARIRIKFETEAPVRIADRAVPARCTAAYGGRRERPEGCPDCPPRLVSAVELSCGSRTIQIAVAPPDALATCMSMTCEECDRFVREFLEGATIDEATCEPLAAPK